MAVRAPVLRHRQDAPNGKGTAKGVGFGDIKRGDLLFRTTHIPDVNNKLIEHLDPHGDKVWCHSNGLGPKQPFAFAGVALTDYKNNNESLDQPISMAVAGMLEVNNNLGRMASKGDWIRVRPVLQQDEDTQPKNTRPGTGLWYPQMEIRKPYTSGYMDSLARVHSAVITQAEKYMDDADAKSPKDVADQTKRMIADSTALDAAEHLISKGLKFDDYGVTECHPHEIIKATDSQWQEVITFLKYEAKPPASGYGLSDSECQALVNDIRMQLPIAVNSILELAQQTQRDDLLSLFDLVLQHALQIIDDVRIPSKAGTQNNTLRLVACQRWAVTYMCHQSRCFAADKALLTYDHVIGRVEQPAQVGEPVLVSLRS